MASTLSFDLGSNEAELYDPTHDVISEYGKYRQVKVDNSSTPKTVSARQYRSSVKNITASVPPNDGLNGIHPAFRSSISVLRDSNNHEDILYWRAVLVR